MSSGPILFYDGSCGLCARSVQWVLRHDHRGLIRFAPLQGQTYAHLPVPSKPMELDTMVLHDHDGLHVRSDAALRLLRTIGGGWGLLGVVGRVIPRALRDGLYRLVARNRHRWFGSEDACRLASPQERARFLD